MKYLCIIVLASLLMAASCEKDKPSGLVDKNPHFRVMFYNTENLFDAIDDRKSMTKSSFRVAPGNGQKPGIRKSLTILRK